MSDRPIVQCSRYFVGYIITDPAKLNWTNLTNCALQYVF
jgi:hypothetical protein